MPDASPALPHRRRWVRRPGVWLLAVLLAALGWGGWREYDFRCAVREAHAAAFYFVESESPLASIRRNWRYAFDKDTWMEHWRTLSLPGDCDLAPLRPLLLRLRPTTLFAVGALHPEALQGLTGLKWLSLKDSPALQDVDGLRGLTGLQTLFLIRCAALKNVDGLRCFTALQILALNDCAALQNVDGLRSLTGLQVLHLHGCKNLPVSALPDLRAALPQTVINFPDGPTTPP